MIYEHKNLDGTDSKHLISIAHDGKQIGSDEIGFSMNAIKDRERKLLWGNVATLFLLVAGLLVVQRWALARLLKKPVDAFVGATQDMVEGRYQAIGLGSSLGHNADRDDRHPKLSNWTARQRALPNDS